MTINGTNGVSAGTPTVQSGMSQAVDPVSKDIQSQISRLQKQLQELSANTEMGSEAKMKKRQELQKQISDLNAQLRQHQIEMRKKEREEKASFDDMLGGKPQDVKAKEKGQGASISSSNMEAMVSAGAAMEQAKVHGTTAAKAEHRAGILKAEIALDSGRGGGSNTDLKHAELADAEQKAMEATSSQMGMLSKANKEMEEAAKEDKTNKNDEKTEKADDKKSGKTAETEEESAGSVTNAVSAIPEGSMPEETEAVIAPVRQHVSVDVRL